MIRFISVADRSLRWQPRLLILALVFSAADITQVDASEPPLQVAQLERDTPVDYNSEILPLLKQNCLACHHEKEAEGGCEKKCLWNIPSQLITCQNMVPNS